MKHFVILYLITSFSAFSSSALIELNIEQADQLLVKQGWKPLPLQCEYEDIDYYWFANDAPEVHKAGIKSVHSCSGTGQNYCSFYYQKSLIQKQKSLKQCLKVVTEGEFGFKGLESLIVKSVFKDCPEEC